MKKELLKVAFRQNALIVFDEWVVKEDSVLMDEVTSSLLANSIKLGYTFSEELLHKIDKISPINKKEIFDLITEITGLKKNWTPLVKNWGQPTGESIIDHRP